MTHKNLGSENQIMPTPIRNKVIKIRLTDDEFAELNKRKTRPELARWIRETVLEQQSKKSLPIRPKVRPEIPNSLVMLVAGMSNNLNQIAKQLNTAAKHEYLNQGTIVQALLALRAAERNINLLREFFYNHIDNTKGN